MALEFFFQMEAYKLKENGFFNFINRDLTIKSQKNIYIHIYNSNNLLLIVLYLDLLFPSPDIQMHVHILKTFMENKIWCGQDGFSYFLGT